MRYQAPEKTEKKSTKANPLFTLVILLLLLVVGYKLLSKRLDHTAIIHHQQQTTADETGIPPAEQQWVNYIVKKGDSMARIFNRFNLDPQDLHSIMQLGQDSKALANLRVGQALDLLITENPDQDSQYQNLRALKLRLTARDTLFIKFTNDKYQAEVVEQPIEYQTESATATINNSFLAAGTKAKIPQAVLRQIISLFSWRIDFKRDMRKNDNFTVIYQSEYLNGEKIKTGDVIAAEFVNKNTKYYAIRYQTAKGDIGYFNSTGASVRKAFLRRPVKIGYISSPFNMHRRHPILGYVRPHTGTDFAAPYGTPIHATGDGRISFLGRKGGYGRAIMIRHGSKIVTLYGHMSRYGRGLKKGSYVKQGQVIGYIGTSGLSTGPHVHYEFRINNKFHNPMTVRLPNAAPVPKAERAAYLTFAEQEITKLNDYREQNKIN